MQPLLQRKSNDYYKTCVCVCVCVCVFVTLGIQHSMCMRYIVIYNIFPRYLRQHGFENELLNFKCVFRVFIQLLSEIFLILRRTERDIIENVYWFSCKVPFILIRF